MTDQQDLSQADLEQVRKILFGRQIKESEKRVETVERSFRSEIQALRGELVKRIEALEALLRKQGEALTKSLGEEAAEREAVEEILGKQLGELKKATEGHVARLGETHTRATRELRQRLVSDVKAAREELGARIGQLSDEVDLELEELRDASVAKDDLSGYLGDIALKLVNKKQIRRS